MGVGTERKLLFWCTAISVYIHDHMLTNVLPIWPRMPSNIVTHLHTLIYYKLCLPYYKYWLSICSRPQLCLCLTLAIHPIPLYFCLYLVIKTSSEPLSHLNHWTLEPTDTLCSCWAVCPCKDITKCAPRASTSTSKTPEQEHSSNNKVSGLHFPVPQSSLLLTIRLLPT